jgi:phosphomannomutase
MWRPDKIWHFGMASGHGGGIYVRRAVNGIARYVVSQKLELIKQDKIAIGGEESTGLSIRSRVPEKDGILAGLLCCEMIAAAAGLWDANCTTYLPKLVPSIPK